VLLLRFVLRYCVFNFVSWYAPYRNALHDFCHGVSVSSRCGKQGSAIHVHSS